MRQFVRMAEETCLAHDFDPLITFTTMSSIVADATMPILFDRDQPGAAKRADACYRSLFEAGRRLGHVPYRFGAGYMD